MAEKNSGVDSVSRFFAKYIHGPNMSLTVLGAICAFLLAAFLANYTYTKLQKTYQTQLMELAGQTDILASACSKIPSVDVATCRLSESTDTRENLSDTLIWSILIEAGIVDRLDVETPANLSEFLSSELAIKKVYEMLKSVDREKETGLDFLIGLSRGMCSKSDGLGGDLEYQKAIAYYVAGLFPSITTDASQLNDFEALSDNKGPEDIDWNVSWFTGVGYTEARFPLNLRRYQTPRGVTDAEIAGQLLLNSYASDRTGYRYTPDQLSKILKDNKENPFKCELGDLSPAEIWQGFDNFEKLLTWGLGQVRTTPEYRATAYKLTLYTGPEQFLIFFVGFFALILSLSRMMIMLSKDSVLSLLVNIKQQAKSHSPSERGYWKDQLMDQLISARWPMRLAITILPAIGFIGTVRGIMKSLTGADGIVWATTASERAQAISELSADLGLAFATTMLALIFGIVLSILSAIEIRLIESAVLPLYSANAFALKEDGATDQVSPSASLEKTPSLKEKNSDSIDKPPNSVGKMSASIEQPQEGLKGFINVLKKGFKNSLKKSPNKGDD